MALGDVERIEAGLGIVQQTATGFGKIALVTAHPRVPPLLCGCHGRGIPHIHPQGFELRPRRGGHLLLEILQLVKPTPNP
jgi:hypothetical protein